MNYDAELADMHLCDLRDAVSDLPVSITHTPTQAGTGMFSITIKDWTVGAVCGYPDEGVLVWGALYFPTLNQEHGIETSRQALARVLNQYIDTTLGLDVERRRL